MTASKNSRWLEIVSWAATKCARSHCLCALKRWHRRTALCVLLEPAQTDIQRQTDNSQSRTCWSPSRYCDNLEKLKKFELVVIPLPYTSDTLLCRIPAYVKSTIAHKLALNPFERYSQEDNRNCCHTDQSKSLSHPTTLKVTRYLISLETGSGTS